MIWRVLLSGLFGATLLLVPVHARATPDFPETMYDALEMDCVPQCVLCHKTPAGGAGMLDKPVVNNFVASGLEPDNNQSLRNALTNMEGDPLSDADNDGMNDVAELRAGRDPNVAGVGFLCGPNYGCGARIAPHTTPDSLGALSAGLVAAALAFAMRRSRPRSAD